MHDGCVGGHGIRLRSIVDIGEDLAAGRLERVLPGWSGEAAPIVALYASRNHRPRELRVFLDAIVAALRRRQAIASAGS